MSEEQSPKISPTGTEKHVNEIEGDSMLSYKNLVADIQARVLDGGYNQPKPLTPERRAIVEKNISDVAAFMNNFHKPWFMAGGVSTELSHGELQRDHDDIDTSIYYDDLDIFWEYAKEQGYALFDHENNSYSTRALLDKYLAAADNVVLRKVRAGLPGPDFFEVMLLRNGSEERSVRGPYGIDIPRAHYDTTKHVMKNGQDVPLTPIVIQLLHKAIDGRQKDFVDLKSHLPLLSSEERMQLDTMIAKSHMTFVVGEHAIGTLDELLEYTEAAGMAVQLQGVTEKTPGIVAERVEQMRSAIEKLYSVFEQSADENAYLDAVKVLFSADVVESRKDEIKKISDFLFQHPRPTREEFEQFVGSIFSLEKFIGPQVRTEVLRVPRWKIGRSGDLVE